MKPRFTNKNELLHEYNANTHDKLRPVVKTKDAAPLHITETRKQTMKPKYADRADFLHEFNQTTRDLDKANPKDPAFAPKASPRKTPALTESTERVAPVAPRAEPARMSRYSSPQRALDSFRVLAGMTESVSEPWNPSIVAETRSINSLMKAYGMNEDSEDSDEDDADDDDKGDHGWSAKAAHRAVSHSERTTSEQHAAHSIMPHLTPKEQTAKKHELAQMSLHSARKLRGTANGAPHHVHHELHDLADAHEKHARIYMKGGRPKLH